MMESSSTDRLNPRSVTWLSVLVNTLLAAGKILAGVVFYSQTILADGLHSLSDLVTDIAVLAGLRVSDKPADDCHHYGHRRVSTLTSLFIGAALLAAAGYIAYNAINLFHDFIDNKSMPAVRPVLPLVMALLSIVSKEILFRVTRIVGQRVGDNSLIANAWHHRSDAFSSIAAAAGLAGVLIGGENWRFLDPLMAIVLSAFLVVVALQIMYSSASELIDRAPEAQLLATIEQAIRDTHGVRSHHAFRARRIGGKVDMDVHVQVDPNLTVHEGHDIASAVRDAVQRADANVVKVIVHVEPAAGPLAD
ncbi:MAG TPA: cation-efflux pump [Phycisphaerales bacterium]|nr:cation-efflux pump [Phycisphaerales bacterium]